MKSHTRVCTNVDGILGGRCDPPEGHLDPSGTPYAYAKAARMGGTEIHLRTKVLETNVRVDGSWESMTDKGTIIAAHMVNAAGPWARDATARKVKAVGEGSSINGVQSFGKCEVQGSRTSGGYSQPLLDGPDTRMHG